MLTQDHVLVQLRASVAQLMATVHAMPVLSMEDVGEAARLALPQTGCSYTECVWSCPD